MTELSSVEELLAEAKRFLKEAHPKIRATDALIPRLIAALSAKPAAPMPEEVQRLTNQLHLFGTSGNLSPTGQRQAAIIMLDALALIERLFADNADLLAKHDAQSLMLTQVGRERDAARDKALEEAARELEAAPTEREYGTVGRMEPLSAEEFCEQGTQRIRALKKICPHCGHPDKSKQHICCGPLRDTSSRAMDGDQPNPSDIPAAPGETVVGDDVSICPDCQGSGYEGLGSGYICRRCEGTGGEPLR
jgi:hypothetical protein